MRKAAVLVLIVWVCIGCGVSDLNVQIVSPEDATQRAMLQATGQPTTEGLRYYQADQARDLTFYYPHAWQVSTAPNRLWIDTGAGVLHIVLGGQSAPEVVSPLTPAGEHTILGMTANGQVSDLPTGHSVRLYTPVEGLQLGDLRIDIWLESENLSAAPIAEVEALLDSLRFPWLGTPPDTLRTWVFFEDSTNGLAFYYPPDWAVSATEHYVQVTREDIRLHIVHGNLTARTGMPAGEFRNVGGVVIQEQVLPVVGLVVLEQTKLVLFGDPHQTARVGDQRVFAELSSTAQGSYDEIRISDETWQLVGQILATLEPCCEAVTP